MGVGVLDAGAGKPDLLAVFIQQEIRCVPGCAHPVAALHQHGRLAMDARIRACPISDDARRFHHGIRAVHRDA